MVSPSISPLSYSFTVTSGLVTVIAFMSSLVRVFNTAGVSTTGLTFTTVVVFFCVVSFTGFLTGTSFFVTGGLVAGFFTGVVVFLVTGGLVTGFLTGGARTGFILGESFFRGGSLSITGTSFFTLLRRKGSI